MSSKKWKCLEIHTKSFDERNNLVRNIVELMRQLKKEKHVESYFFNRYSNPKENAFFIKFGLVNADRKAESNVDGILKKNSSIKDIKPYDCEMWKVDDISIDEIKCIACELHEIVWDGFKDKPTIEQAFYLLHFLMNQLGYSYAEEYRLYKMLDVNIGKKLGK